MNPTHNRPDNTETQNPYRFKALVIISLISIAIFFKFAGILSLQNLVNVKNFFLNIKEWNALALKELVLQRKNSFKNGAWQISQNVVLNRPFNKN